MQQTNVIGPLHECKKVCPCTKALPQCVPTLNITLEVILSDAAKLETDAAKLETDAVKLETDEDYIQILTT